MLRLKDIRSARKRLEGRILKTPVLPFPATEAPESSDTLLKCENLQFTGSFKVRGAFNFLLSHLESARAKGVVAASAGNHAQGLAFAGSRLGVSVTVVMPEATPLTKVRATEALGAAVELFGDVFDDALERARQLAGKRRACFVPAFDHEAIMAGQGTLGLEILEQVADIETLLVPVGGGGLISGVSVAVKALQPRIRIVGVEAQGADAARLSRLKGERVCLPHAHSLADGIAIKCPGALCFDIMQQKVDEIVTVSEDEISRAMVTLMETARLLVEGAGAVSLAARLYRSELHEGRALCLLSGGNVDLQTLDRVVRRGLVGEGRYLKVRVELADHPGSLARLTALLEQKKANIYQISHDRRNERIALERSLVLLELETRGFAHIEELLAALDEAGYAPVVSR